MHERPYATSDTRPIPGSNARQTTGSSGFLRWQVVCAAVLVCSCSQQGILDPQGPPVEFRLTSATVMNSFFIPQLGSQIYTMGGMTTHLNLLADKPGEFPGFSAMFSGDGFSDMRFIAKAVPPSDFDAWVAQVRGAGSVLDDDAYAELAKPSVAVPPKTYRSVAPDLFDHIRERTVSGPESHAGTAWCPPVRQAGG